MLFPWLVENDLGYFLTFTVDQGQECVRAVVTQKFALFIYLSLKCCFKCPNVSYI